MTQKMKAYGNLVRQGDVLLQCLTSVPELDDKPIVDPRGIVLAEGETSNHHHAVVGRSAKLFAYKMGGRDARVLVVGRGGAEIRVVGGGAGGVDRHTPIRVKQGMYEVRVQRSWTSAHASRRVED